jgi:UDP-galactopyranose mutase
MEIPSKNGKHYPLPFKSEINKAHKYIKKLPSWFFSIGRAGTYRYEVDIDDSIEQALEIDNIIKDDKYNGAFPLGKWWEV